MTGEKGYRVLEICVFMGWMFWQESFACPQLVKESTLSGVCLCVCCSQLHGDLTLGFTRASADVEAWSTPTQFEDFVNRQSDS